MKAGETTFLRFLESRNQFVIPIFQRTYSWKEKQCKQLWDDIVRVACDKSGFGHFIGSIVYIRDSSLITQVPQLMVIDGQQRLTTITILLSALSEHLKEIGGASEISHEKINNIYLFNSFDKGDSRYKLLLTQSDRETLKRLIEGKELPENASTRIVENHRYFKEQIKKCGLNIDDLFQGIQRLFIVEISLDRTSDDPQLIFESLNSTGMDLSQADLIRNYVLMGLKQDEQEALYNFYWHPMEEKLDSEEYEKLLDMFMRDYITMKTGRIPNINEIYFAFKAYSSKQNLPMKQLVEEVFKFAKYYANMALEKDEDEDLKKMFDNINELEVYVSYPFLLAVYDDYANHKITKDQFIEILKIIESYVFRRSVCGIPTNSLNKTFATLYKEIDQNNYMESLKVAFLTKTSYRRFPSDEEFKNEFVIKDLYHTRNCWYLLSKIENYNEKAEIDLSKYTIEHILPQNQNLSSEWINDLGHDWQEKQKKYLHTIGNLTLTCYNSEMSDKPFREKKNCEGGLTSSRLLRLNKMLAQHDRWGEEEIKMRANELADVALKIWNRPITQLPIEHVNTPSASTDDVESLFFSTEDYTAARNLVKDLFSVVSYDKIKQATSVYYNGEDMLSVVIGSWVVLKFIKYSTSVYIGFCIDRGIYPNGEIEFSEVGQFAKRYSGGKKFELVWFDWNSQRVLPAKFLDAWHAALLHASEQFGGWHIAEDKIDSSEKLVKALISE